jgi:alpha-beta hydrolase superfamily lysophospholipase
VNEEAILLEGSTPLVGVVTVPAPGAFDPGRPAIVLLNAGLSHRVGPGRLSVKLARHLARRGFVSLRFDASGLGDSPARSDSLPVEQSGVLETREAMDYLARTRRIESFCVVGLCSGAVFAFRTALQDSRVAGIGLLNARGFDRSAHWQRDVESRTWLRRYLRRLVRPGAWWRALTGQTEYRRLGRIVRARAASLIAGRDEVGRVARELADDMVQLLRRGVAVLWLAADDDPSLDYLAAIERRAQGPLPPGLLERVTLAGANHTFTQLVDQQQVLAAVESWITARWPAADPEAPGAATSAAL